MNLFLANGISDNLVTCSEPTLLPEISVKGRIGTRKSRFLNDFRCKFDFLLHEFVKILHTSRIESYKKITEKKNYDNIFKSKRSDIHIILNR